MLFWGIKQPCVFWPLVAVQSNVLKIGSLFLLWSFCVLLLTFSHAHTIAGVRLPGTSQMDRERMSAGGERRPEGCFSRLLSQLESRSRYSLISVSSPAAEAWQLSWWWSWRPAVQITGAMRPAGFLLPRKVPLADFHTNFSKRFVNCF